ncbi:MAG: preprotein translocase subunit TatC [Caldilineaceae bacterium]|nr:preprotein translocase subunit TatC [Caldilineaceae bacterium]
MSQQVQSLDPIEESSMTLMEHLVELRGRLMWIAGALVIGTLISMIFVNPLLRFITAPLDEYGVVPQAIGPTDTIGIFFKVSFTTGRSAWPCPSLSTS